MSEQARLSSDDRHMSVYSTPMSALPEIPIADADDATLAIYRKLMAAAGSGSPALIFRHLAVYPGLLDWVWRALGDEVESGWPRQAVMDLLAVTDAVPLTPITVEELAQTGIDAAARETVGHMLTSYNRMNPVNLVMIGAVQMLISGNVPTGTDFEIPGEIAQPPAATPDLPPPPRVADLSTDMQALFRRLCVPIPDLGAETTPTMYRHFAIWPAFMAAVGERLEVRLDDLDQATLTFADAVRPLAQTLALRALSRIENGPPVKDAAPLIRTLDGFGYVIPHMVVVGKAIEAALAD